MKVKAVDSMKIPNSCRVAALMTDRKLTISMTCKPLEKNIYKI